jgi:hypothetical protein
MPTTAAAGKLLGIYLNDHLAVATGGVELARRAAGEHREGELGAFLAALRDELDAQRHELETAMERLGVARSTAKQAVAWAGEKAGRLKLNGQLTGSSPLTPLVELEGLAVVVDGLRMLWSALGEAAPATQELGAERLAGLARRAQRHGEQLERHRRGVAATALS